MPKERRCEKNKFMNKLQTSIFESHALQHVKCEKIVSPPHTEQAPPTTIAATAATRNCLTHSELRSIEIYVNLSVCMCVCVKLWLCELFFRTRLSLCHIWNYARFFSAAFFFFLSPCLRKKYTFAIFSHLFHVYDVNKRQKTNKKPDENGAVSRRDRETNNEQRTEEREKKMYIKL